VTSSKKPRPGAWAIKDLGEGQVRLEDRELIPIARRAVGRGERMRQGRSHLRRTASILTASSVSAIRWTRAGFVAQNAFRPASLAATLIAVPGGIQAQSVIGSNFTP
jgi:hypothetical protein